MKIYWWDEKGYGGWAFVLAESEEKAWELLLKDAIETDKKDLWLSNNGVYENHHYCEAEVERYRKLNSLQVIEPGIVKWGEFA